MAEHVETPNLLKMDIHLPRCGDGELAFLQEWGKLKFDRWPRFCQWLLHVVASESKRRTEQLAEPEMLELPALDSATASDFLLGSYVLVKQPLTEALAKFADELQHHTVCAIGGILAAAAEDV